MRTVNLGRAFYALRSRLHFQSISSRSFMLDMSSHCILLCCIYVVLWKSTDGACSGTIFHEPQPTCPEQRAVFSCKSEDDIQLHRTVWGVSETGAPYGGCPLVHSNWPHTSIVCGSFMGQSAGEFPDYCFESELSVTATQSLNGTVVVCSFADGGTPETRGSGTLKVIGMFLIDIIKEKDTSRCLCFLLHKVPSKP